MHLSKSTFVNGLQCIKYLWLQKHRRDLKTPVSEALQATFDQGHEIGNLAKEYFKGGKEIESPYYEHKKAIDATLAAVAANHTILYEPAAQFKDVRIRADILKQSDESRSHWDLIEVKASTSEKGVYLPDAAIQYYVLQNSGFKMNKAYLMLINNKYVRRGPVSPKKLFKLIDMTEKVKDFLPRVPKTIQDFYDMLANKEEPGIDIGPHCETPYECPFMDHCWACIPRDSICECNFLGWKKIEALRDMGVKTTGQIPDDFKLTEREQKFFAVLKSKKPKIDKKQVRELLDDLKYPVYFLDFETIGPAIPQYDLARPYQNCPFQFSLRIFGESGGQKHIEFLGDGKTDPRPEIARLLVENIGPEGSVAAYSASFEKNVMKNLAVLFPKYRKALKAINKRLWDLMIPFSKGYYLHPNAHCSASIKKVLPALIPSMTYENMDIGQGSAASQAYLDLMANKFPYREAEKTRENLLKYCAQDTLAMVKLLDILKNC
ncbi:DUF2779 domain-containing protein [Elusimicrobiota bacterium]